MQLAPEQLDILKSIRKNTDLYMSDHVLKDTASHQVPPSAILEVMANRREPITSDRQMQEKIDKYENQFLKAQLVYRELFQKNESEVLNELKAEKDQKHKLLTDERIQLSKAQMLL